MSTPTNNTGAVLMRGQESSRGSRVLVGATVAAMSAAGIAMFLL